MKENIKHPSHSRWAIIFGIFLVVLGALFLAFNIGLLESAWRQVFVSWQMVLIIVAIILLFHRHFFKGLILFSLGAFYLIPRLAAASPDAFSWVKEDFTHAYSPVFLMIAGVLILLHIFLNPKRLSRKQLWKNHHTTEKTSNQHQKKSTIHSDLDQNTAAENVKQNFVFENEKTEDTKNRRQKRKKVRSNFFERNSIFRSISEIIHELEFEGGSMNAVFGNITLDLRKTTIPENVGELNINVIFGGITIFVPETWNVEVHLNSIFGNLQDSRVHSNETEKTHTLIIHGICVFGNGEIKN